MKGEPTNLPVVIYYLSESWRQVYRIQHRLGENTNTDQYNEITAKMEADTKTIARRLAATGFHVPDGDIKRIYESLRLAWSKS